MARQEVVHSDGVESSSSSDEDNDMCTKNVKPKRRGLTRRQIMLRDFKKLHGGYERPVGDLRTPSELSWFRDIYMERLRKKRNPPQPQHNQLPDYIKECLGTSDDDDDDDEDEEEEEEEEEEEATAPIVKNAPPDSKRKRKRRRGRRGRKRSRRGGKKVLQ